MRPLRIYVGERIRDDTITTKEGKSIRIRNQEGFVYGRSDMSLVPCTIRLDDAPAYQPDRVYELADASVDVSDRGFRFGFGPLSLVEVDPKDKHAVICRRMLEAAKAAAAVDDK